MKPKTTGNLLVGLLILGLAAPPSSAQPAAGDYVTREEYEKLLKEIQQLKTQQRPVQPTVAAPDAATEEALDDLEIRLKDVRALAQATQPGLSRFLVTGYGFAGYTDAQGAPSSFNAGFSPILLWTYGDRVFFEGELELELEGGETGVELEYANMAYLLNDYVTVHAGKFLTPLGTFSERLHPAWINKLPDFPLGFGHGGLAPMSTLGAGLRGGFALGATRANYSIYVGNGPTLEVDGHHIGELEFENFTDIDQNKAVGARFSFLPIPELEIGYSAYFAKVDAAGTSEDDLDVLLQSVDLSYTRETDLLKGTIDLRAQWIYSIVDDATYFDNVGNPLVFDNTRDGAFAQIAYRPSKLQNDVIRSFEPVFRYDWVNAPNEIRYDQHRYTFGLNYWLTSNMLLKFAYQKNNRNNGRGDVEAYMVQAAIGF